MGGAGTGANPGDARRGWRGRGGVARAGNAEDGRFFSLHEAAQAAVFDLVQQGTQPVWYALGGALPERAVGIGRCRDPDCGVRRRERHQGRHRQRPQRLPLLRLCEGGGRRPAGTTGRGEGQVICTARAIITFRLTMPCRWACRRCRIRGWFGKSKSGRASQESRGPCHYGGCATEQWNSHPEELV